MNEEFSRAKEAFRLSGCDPSLWDAFWLGWCASLHERWASIETAPKDGRTVLLNRDGSRRVYTGRFVADTSPGFWIDTHGQQRDPSRWMPLPTGPEVCSEHGWVGGAAYYRDGHDKHDRRDSSG